MQRLLRKAVWDADAVRDDTRDWLIERLGHPEGVLVGDETGLITEMAAFPSTCAISQAGCSRPTSPFGRMSHAASRKSLDTSGIALTFTEIGNHPGARRVLRARAQSTGQVPVVFLVSSP